MSRISNPASSMRTAMRCWVRVPAKASRCPPGLSTRRHSAQISDRHVVVPLLAHERQTIGRIGDDGVDGVIRHAAKNFKAVAVV